MDERTENIFKKFNDISRKATENATEVSKKFCDRMTKYNNDIRLGVKYVTSVKDTNKLINEDNVSIEMNSKDNTAKLMIKSSKKNVATCAIISFTNEEITEALTLYYMMKR